MTNNKNGIYVGNQNGTIDLDNPIFEGILTSRDDFSLLGDGIQPQAEDTEAGIHRSRDEFKQSIKVDEHFNRNSEVSSPDSLSHDSAMKNNLPEKMPLHSQLTHDSQLPLFDYNNQPTPLGVGKSAAGDLEASASVTSSSSVTESGRAPLSLVEGHWVVRNSPCSVTCGKGGYAQIVRTLFSTKKYLCRYHLISLGFT